MSDLNRASQIPNFITASSPQGLRRLMFKTNIRLGGFIHYFSIQFVDGKWIAWFHEDLVNEFQKPKENSEVTE